MKACDLATDVEAAVDSGDYDEFDSDIYDDAGNSLVFVKTNWTTLVSPRSFTRHRRSPSLADNTLKVIFFSICGY